jgi:hypothetical protein
VYISCQQGNKLVKVFNSKSNNQFPADNINQAREVTVYPHIENNNGKKKKKRSSV